MSVTKLQNWISSRDKGALGTRSAARYAFGLHLNPDLPALNATTLVQYMQAYLCLYDWIYANEEIDVARKVTPYITWGLNRESRRSLLYLLLVESLNVSNRAA